MITGLYRHYKGGLYTAVGICEDSTNRPDASGKSTSSEEPMVLYVSHEHPKALKARALSQWNERVEWPNGLQMPRFVLVEDPFHPQ